MKKFTLLLSLLFAIVSIQAQDYRISFAGTGASTTVGTVTVENLTQGKSITLSGTEVLHLVATGTGIDPILEREDALHIYPNPTTGNSKIDFVATATGKAKIELFDIAARRIGAAQNSLTIGTHSYQVSGLRSGIYTVRITSPAYTYTGKLVSNGAPNSLVKIIYTGYIPTPITSKKLKSANTERLMQYNMGDWLKYTGTSGNYSTVVNDIPTSNKMISFTFVACTDGDGNNYLVEKIGTQVWMAENLKTTKYCEGTAIPSVANGEIPCYFWYNNDEASYKNTYGALYNWYTVNTGKLAPRGWHVPTDDEWQLLVDCINATGSKFTTIVGGSGTSKNGFNGIGENGYWWSSTKYGNYMPSSRYLKNMYSTYEYDETGSGTGLSVRCVRDPNVLAVNTNFVSSVTTTSAIFGGDITNDGGTSVTERGICYSTSKTPTISNSKMAMGNGVGIFTKTITGLTPNTIYYVRAYATNSAGTKYGNEVAFTTFTGTFTDIDGNVYNTVSIGSQVWMAENLKTTKFNDGVSIPNVTVNADWSNLATPGYCWYNNDITNKSTYGALYNWYAVNSGRLCPKGWHVPSGVEWENLNVADSKLIETGLTHWLYPIYGATNETSFTALPGGYRSNGSAGIGVFGNWWTSDVRNNIDGTELVKIMGNTFNVALLKEEGCSVRCVKDAITIPDLNTIAASSITTISAIFGGNISSDGGSAVTERGICYSTNQNPTTSNSKVVMSSGTGNFSNIISGLAANTTYYVRAYAMNSVGTAYGNEVSFKTFTGTVTDIDGNVYNTIIIGTQEWMVENLKTTKYNDGTSILNVTDNTAWSNLSTPGYCWYNNDVANKSTYGALYNWYAVNTGKLAPIGWHVPTDAEWTTLTSYLGGTSAAGGKLKETGTTHWNSPNTGATNETGFTAFPGGGRNYIEAFYNIGDYGYWWSSTKDDTYDAWYQHLGCYDNDIYRNFDGKSCGFSVRCVRD